MATYNPLAALHSYLAGQIKSGDTKAEQVSRHNSHNAWSEMHADGNLRRAKEFSEFQANLERETYRQKTAADTGHATSLESLRGSNAVKLQNAQNSGAVKLERQRGTNATDLERLRGTNATDLERLRGTNAADLVKAQGNETVRGFAAETRSKKTLLEAANTHEVDMFNRRREATGQYLGHMGAVAKQASDAGVGFTFNTPDGFSTTFGTPRPPASPDGEDDAPAAPKAVAKPRARAAVKKAAPPVGNALTEEVAVNGSKLAGAAVVGVEQSAAASPAPVKKPRASRAKAATATLAPTADTPTAAPSTGVGEPAVAKTTARKPRTPRTPKPISKPDDESQSKLF